MGGLVYYNVENGCLYTIAGQEVSNASN